MLFAIFFFLIHEFVAGLLKEKSDLCTNFLCKNTSEEVCGLKSEGEGFRIKLFKNECDLIKYNCEVDNAAYDVISMDFCMEAFKTESKHQSKKVPSSKKPCIEYDCSITDAIKVCGIKKDGEGFRVRYFENKCRLWKYNCEKDMEFSVTDLHICNGAAISDTNEESGNDDKNNANVILEERSVNNDNITEIDNNPSDTETKNKTDTKADKIENIVVVRSPMMNFRNINESIDNFFAGTHVFDLPVREMDTSFLNESTRRRLIRVARPIKVFVPFVIKPKNVSEDHDHIPTLGSCYHKCPRTCPDTYAPVCGVPGQVAREPSLMFQNHCFMDVAQCKMYWENKSPTSLSSAYVESSFIFCLGNEMNSMFRFLPLIRTLQHMGRLRNKGRFHYQFKNMKFFHNMLFRQPKLMG